MRYLVQSLCERSEIPSLLHGSIGKLKKTEIGEYKINRHARAFTYINKQMASHWERRRERDTRGERTEWECDGD